MENLNRTAKNVLDAVSTFTTVVLQSQLGMETKNASSNLSTTTHHPLTFKVKEIYWFEQYLNEDLVFDKNFYIEFIVLYNSYKHYLDVQNRNDFLVPKRKLWGLLCIVAEQKKKRLGEFKANS